MGDKELHRRPEHERMILKHDQARVKTHVLQAYFSAE